jgi:hypothetical protein
MLSVGTKEAAMLVLSVTSDNRQHPTQLQRQWGKSYSARLLSASAGLALELPSLQVCVYTKFIIDLAELFNHHQLKAEFRLPRCRLAGLLTSLAARNSSAKDARVSTWRRPGTCKIGEINLIFLQSEGQRDP